jgi:hypothetical protein
MVQINPQTPTAVNDVLNAPYGIASTVNVLSNDDFRHQLRLVSQR